MAIKKYTAKVTGVHALTGISLVKGQEYEVEETLAGSDIFEEVKIGKNINRKPASAGPPEGVKEEDK